MVGTILPIGYGERKSGRRLGVLFFHLLGAVSGAASLGSLAGALGAGLYNVIGTTVTPSLVLSLTGIIAIPYALRELRIIPVPAPQFSRQVPHKWRLIFPPKVMAFCYGLGLGLGVATRIPVTTFYIPLLWTVLVGDPWLGALALGGFGVGRALPLVWILEKVSSVSDCRVFVRSLGGWEPMVRAINGLALGLAGSCLLIAGFGPR